MSLRRRILVPVQQRMSGTRRSEVPTGGGPDALSRVLNGYWTRRSGVPTGGGPDALARVLNGH
jgi:hypothetical protein